VKRAIAIAMLTIAVVTIPALLAAQTPVQPGAEQMRRHEQINLFEGTLEKAVTNAARHVAKDVQSRTSNANFFTGDARAKGFILDGYGVFVYVEIPALDLSLTLMNYQLEQSVERLERDAQRKAEGDAAKGEASPVSNRTTELKTEPAPVVPKTNRELLQSVMDTGQNYRNEVKLALTDAMLDFTKNLELKPDEWLSVAARGSDGALTPGEILQLTTVVLRIKGSDLSDYLAGRLTREEARAKVEVRQF
jgi:hypothetical protein